MKYDFLIVGAGFAGATCARILTDNGYKCLIIEERPFVGGMCVTTNQDGIDIHVLGPHVFHTNNKKIWDFVNKYSDFELYRLQESIVANGKIYHNRLNLELLREIYNDGGWPDDYKKILKKDLYKIETIKNAEDYCLKYFGKTIYKTLFKPYYEKKYNKLCDTLPDSIIDDNITCDFIVNNDKWDDIYQGVPKIGYTLLIEKIIGKDIPIMLNTDFESAYNKLKDHCKYIIYTGELDRLFNYCIGPLEWTSYDYVFKDESLNSSNITGNPITKFCNKDIPWFRVIEHKWFRKDLKNEPFFKNIGYVTYEKYKKWEIGEKTFEPILTKLSISKYKQYIDYMKKKYPNMLICGAKAEYKNMSISDTIESSFNLCDKIIKNKL